MATRMKMLKLLQEIRGFSELSRMHSVPKPPALFLMQLRDRIAESNRPRRRIRIQIEMQAEQILPDPVKITFVRKMPTAEHAV
jgi:hypothetical protein